ncbi:MAG: hypothetical protein GX275_08625 [Clostridiales bacterium]|nr:hypothetical protein [Clostridiales bacterium]
MFSRKNIKIFILLYILILCGAFLYQYAIGTYAASDITHVSTEDKEYLEKNTYGFQFPKGYNINKAKLTKGKDSGICLQFKSKVSFNNYINQVVSSENNNTFYVEQYKTIDGVTIDAETMTVKINGNTVYFRIYTKDNEYFLEMFSGKITNEVTNIFT